MKLKTLKKIVGLKNKKISLSKSLSDSELKMSNVEGISHRKVLYIPGSGFLWLDKEDVIL